MPNYMTTTEVFAIMDRLAENEPEQQPQDTTGWVICEHCGELVPSTSTVTCEGGEQQWCEHCVDYWAVECDHCHKLVDVELSSVVIDRNGDECDWCQSCVERDAHECERCGQLCENTVEVECYHGGYSPVTEDWCQQCADNYARTCEDCGALVSRDDIEEYRIYGQGWTFLCPDCHDDHYNVCERCGILITEDDVEWDDEEPYCPDCMEARANESISGYHHTSANCFINDDGSMTRYDDASREQRNGLYLGIELEVDDLNDKTGLARYILNQYGRRFECKRDGSLSYDGMEIVTQPCTPKWALGTAIEDIATRAREMGGRSNDTDTCGFHIHINRTYFRDDDAVYRMDRMFHRFNQQMVSFSRRRPSQMHWCDIKGDSQLAEIENIDERKAAYWDRKKYEGRYEAVNNTNEHTVEIRLWRGSLNMETVRATIEFTTGLAIVCNTMSDELAEKLTWTQLKLMVRYALEAADLPHDDFDSYIARREL